MESAITSPIVVDDNGGIEIYRSVEEACAGIEAIDVRAGGLEALDAEGFVLQLNAVGWNVTIERLEPSLRDEEGLLRRVRRYADAVNDVRPRIPDVDATSARNLLQQIISLEAGTSIRSVNTSRKSEEAPRHYFREVIDKIRHRSHE